MALPNGPDPGPPRGRGLHQTPEDTQCRLGRSAGCLAQPLGDASPPSLVTKCPLFSHASDHICLLPPSPSTPKSLFFGDPNPPFPVPRQGTAKWQKVGMGGNIMLCSGFRNLLKRTIAFFVVFYFSIEPNFRLVFFFLLPTSRPAPFVEPLSPKKYRRYARDPRACTRRGGDYAVRLFPDFPAFPHLFPHSRILSAYFSIFTDRIILPLVFPPFLLVWPPSHPHQPGPDARHREFPPSTENSRPASPASQHISWKITAHPLDAPYPVPLPLSTTHNERNGWEVFIEINPRKTAHVDLLLMAYK